MDLTYKLYLLNDDIHTFDDVRFMLKRQFAYPNLQSDSIAEITNRMGRCQIKSSDDVAELELLQEILLKEGFKVEIKKV
jgi:hypothetical protein